MATLIRNKKKKRRGKTDQQLRVLDLHACTKFFLKMAQKILLCRHEWHCHSVLIRDMNMHEVLVLNIQMSMYDYAMYVVCDNMCTLSGW